MFSRCGSGLCMFLAAGAHATAEPPPVSPVEGGIGVGAGAERSVVVSPDLAHLRGEPIGEPGEDLQVLTVRNGRVADQVMVALSG